MKEVTSDAAMRACFDAVAVNAAHGMGWTHYGLEIGCHANFVLLQTHNPVRALRLRATRLKVFKRGRLLAETLASTVHLYLADSPEHIAWMS